MLEQEGVDFEKLTKNDDVNLFFYVWKRRLSSLGCIKKREDPRVQCSRRTLFRRDWMFLGRDQ